MWGENSNLSEGVDEELRYRQEASLNHGNNSTNLGDSDQILEYSDRRNGSDMPTPGGQQDVGDNDGLLGGFVDFLDSIHPSLPEVGLFGIMALAGILLVIWVVTAAGVQTASNAAFDLVSEGL